MNKERRDRLSKVLSTIEEAKAEIEAIRDEEQETFDNMPESFQNGERGEKAQAAVDAMESAVSSAEEIESYIETAME